MHDTRLLTFDTSRLGRVTTRMYSGVLCEHITDVGRYPAWRVAGFQRHVRQSIRHLAFGPNHQAIATRRGERSPRGIRNRSSVELSHEIGQANMNRQ